MNLTNNNQQITLTMTSYICNFKNLSIKNANNLSIELGEFSCPVENLDSLHLFIQKLANLSTQQEKTQGDIVFDEQQQSNPPLNTTSYSKSYYQRRRNDPVYKENANLRSKNYYEKKKNDEQYKKKRSEAAKKRRQAVKEARGI